MRSYFNRFGAPKLNLIFDHAAFLFLRDNDHFEFYHTLQDLYFDTLRKLADRFPRGYIVLDLFIYENCNYERCYISMAEIARLEMACVRAKYLKSFEFLWEYDNQDDRNKEIARNILRSLHMLTGSTFDNDVFTSAYELFQNSLELKKLRENGKVG